MMEFLSQLATNGLVAGAFYMLMGLSFTLIFSATKFYNIAHGIFIPVGAYAAFVLSNMLGLNLLVSIVLGILLSGLLGVAINHLVFLPLRRKKASGSIMLVSSLGIYLAFQALIAILFTSDYRSFEFSERVFRLWGTQITQTQLVTVLLAVIALGGLLILKKTKFGRAIRAIQDSPELASVVGIKVERKINILFFIGSAIAGLTGVLLGLDTGLEPTMGFSLMLKGIIAMILGGSYSLLGASLGAATLGLLESIGTWFIGGLWKDAISFTAMIAYLVAKPLKGSGS